MVTLNLDRNAYATNVESVCKECHPSPGFVQDSVGQGVYSIAIAKASPIFQLQMLKQGWDGYDAEPISQGVLERAEWLWQGMEACKRVVVDFGVKLEEQPQISPGRDGVVGFTWTKFAPKRRLDIWLYDGPGNYSEWCLESKGVSQSGSFTADVGLLALVLRYLNQGN